MINRKQFSRKFAEKYDYTYQSSEQFVKEIFECLAATIFEEGEDVTIPGFGSFKHRTARQKAVRHPVTGEIIMQPERDFVKFTPSELLKTK